MASEPTVEVVQITPGTPTTYRGKRSWGQVKTIKLGRVFHVIYNGEVIGSIAYRMFTREQRTPGRMYVNSRWESPGWGYDRKKRDSEWAFHRPLEAYSKKDAVESIVRDHERENELGIWAQR